MILGGLVLGIIAVLLVWADLRWAGGDALSGGPLSSAHATLEQTCASCHGGALGEVADAACSECHETGGTSATADETQMALFAFQAHAELRSDGAEPRDIATEPACADCHTEHRGRDTSLRRVSDRQCASCHPAHDFARDHPDFGFTREPESDDDSLHFAHGQHVKEVLKRTGWTEPERSCLTCHRPTEDVRGFAAIDFDLHCADCHLGQGSATARLPIDDGDLGAEDGPSVWTLERIRNSGLPGTDWSRFMPPTEFRGAGRRVAKIHVEHEDPWILFNLRKLRQLRYGEGGVVDLLATADASGEDPRLAYEEAAAALAAQADALRGSADPAMQAELSWIEEELGRVRRSLEDPSTHVKALTLPADDSGFAAPESWDELVADLAAPCATCHRLDRATIVRVEDDQRVLTHATFDHAPHVIDRGCLDCHATLPIRQALETTDLASLDDRTEIHNLPAIATCRECHGTEIVASACVDCHTFHPDTASRRAAKLVHLGNADLRQSAGSGTGGSP